MNKELLLKYSLFNNLTEKEIEKFLKVIKNKTYKSNEIIIKEHELGNSIMLLLQGTVNISKALTLKMNHIEKREKEFIKLNSNQYPFFGEISVFNEKNKRTATITADAECTVGILYNEDLIKICKNNKEIGYKIMTNISKKLVDDLLATNNQVLKLTTAFSLIIEKK